MESVLIFIAALVIRLVSADQSFWLDEAASIDLSRVPLSSFLTAIKGDFHPPLFYLFNHFWMLIPISTEWVIRLPNVIFGSLSIVVFYHLLQILFGKDKKKFIIVGTLMYLLNPLHIYYSAELRMYSLNGLFSLLSWLFLIRASNADSKDKKDWWLFVLFTTLNLYTFYGSFFNLFSQLIYIYFTHRDRFRSLLSYSLVSLLLFLPWTPILLSQLSGGGYLTKVLPGWSELSGNLSFKALGLIMAKFTLGRISLANKSAYLIFVLGVSMYFALSTYLATLSKEGKVFLYWFYSSLIMAILVSLWSPVLGYWRFVFLVPAFIGIMVVGVSNLPKEAANFNLWVILIMFIVGNIIFLTTPTAHREDWRGASDLISKNNSVSIINFPAAFAPLRYYSPNSYYYPTQQKLGVIRSDIDQTLPYLLKGKDSIFVFDYLSDLTDKKRQILVWLKEAGFVLQKTHDYNGVGFIYEFVNP